MGTVLSQTLIDDGSEETPGYGRAGPEYQAKAPGFAKCRVPTAGRPFRGGGGGGGGVCRLFVGAVGGVDMFVAPVGWSVTAENEARAGRGSRPVGNIGRGLLTLSVHLYALQWHVRR